MKPILLSALALLASGVLLAADPATNLDISALKTFGTMGKEVTPLSASKEAELFNYSGKGCLTHMWFGGDWPGYDQTRIRLYVDGETNSSIDMELGLGHGIGFGDSTAPWGIARIGKTGHPSGLYNTYQIPFGRSIRITAQLAEGVKGNPPFWWIIRGTENLPTAIGHVILPDTARLRLYKLVNYTAKPLEEFALCNVAGNGALYQVTISAKGLRKSEKDQWKDLSFLEACMRAYIGGKQEPLMLSSGLEDYFLGTYYFNRGLYHTPVAGLTHFNSQENEFSAYRFHEDDPVFFQNGLRLTCRCGEKIGDKVFHEPPTTANYTTYVWLYQW
jgi:hypothetical protein